MPVAEYEALVFGVRQTPTQLTGENLNEISEILWSPSPEVDFLFESLEQPSAIYEYESGHIHALRVNDSFLRLFGYGVGVDSTLQSTFGQFLSPEDFQALLSAFEATAESKGSRVFRFVQHLSGGEVRELQISMKYWGRNEAAKIVFTQFSVPSCAQI